MTHAISRILGCLAFAGAYVFVVGSLLAHDAASGWSYEAFCCNGDNHTGDCQMIPSDSVEVISGGYRISIGPASHRLATRGHVFDFPQALARRSPDGEYHLCLFPDENTPRCFYAPDMSF